MWRGIWIGLATYFVELLISQTLYEQRIQI